ncbi:MAG TPA: dTMP kinase [Coriobacteriia bacterium]
MAQRGVFLTFEGGEGSGKSTQLRTLARRLEAAGLPIRVLREPGGTAVGEAVRELLLDPEHAGLDATAELLLYEASRAQLVADVIEPALEAGEIVICDRFYDSTTAYQGYARGLSLARIAELNAVATGGLAPDRTILLDIDPALGIERATREGADRLEGESLSFHRAVREGFLAIAAAEPVRVRVVDASGDTDAVAQRVAAMLRDVPQLSGVLA